MASAARTYLQLFLNNFLINPLVKSLDRLGVTPITVTLLGLAITFGAAYLLATGHLMAGGSLILIGGAFDMLDGALARHSGRATSSGAFLDSVVDRLSEAAILFGLLWWYTETTDRLGIILSYTTLVLSVLVSYLRARGEGLGLKTTIGLVQRPERIIVLSVGLMIGYPTATLVVVSILSFLTAIHRFLHILQFTRTQEPN